MEQAASLDTPRRVAVVDDNEGIRVLLRTLIELEPDLVVAGEAADGASAVALVLEQEPDVVVLDLAMPGSDGLQVLEELRRQNDGTRVLVYTGFASPEVEQAARARGGRLRRQGRQPVAADRAPAGGARLMLSREQDLDALRDRRPFRRRGLVLRTAIFPLALATAFALYPFGEQNYDLRFALAAAFAAAFAPVVILTPWDRLPHAAQLLPPLLFLLSVALLRDAHAGAASGYGPITLFAVLWLALYGTRAEIAAGVLASGLTLAVPILVVGGRAYPAGGCGAPPASSSSARSSATPSRRCCGGCSPRSRRARRRSGACARRRRTSCTTTSSRTSPSPSSRSPSTTAGRPRRDRRGAHAGAEDRGPPAGEQQRRRLGDAGEPRPGGAPGPGGVTSRQDGVTARIGA